MTLLTNILLQYQDQFISVSMTVDKSLSKDQLEIHLGCKIRTLRIWTSQDRKSVSLFHLYSDASKIYFQKDISNLIDTTVINVILRCLSNT